MAPYSWAHATSSVCSQPTTRLRRSGDRPHRLAGRAAGTAHVVDGDTLTVAGTRVRLSGVDAPETDQICLDASARPWACGIAARDALAALLARGDVACEPVGRDVYGRTLARCRAADGGDVQALMVRRGLALSFARYSHQYDDEEVAARTTRQGLWAGAFVAPWDWRHRTPRTVVLGAASVPVAARALIMPAPSASETEPPSGASDAGNAPVSGCVIKGNLSRSGERIYHLPGQSHYAEVQMRPGDGKRWFCTEDEARAAGWRRALR